MPTSKSLEFLRDHAYLAWEAEVENARRVTSRRTVALTQIAVVLSVLVLKLATDKAHAVLGSGGLGVAMSVSLLIAVFFLAKALVSLVVSGSSPSQVGAGA